MGEGAHHASNCRDVVQLQLLELELPGINMKTVSSPACSLLDLHHDMLWCAAAIVGREDQPAEGDCDDYKVRTPYLCCCSVEGAQGSIGSLEGDPPSPLPPPPYGMRVACCQAAHKAVQLYVLLLPTL